jgi:thiol:disulfide interchange protein DsbC
MKRVLLIIVCMTLAFSVCGCNGAKNLENIKLIQTPEDVQQTLKTNFPEFADAVVKESVVEPLYEVLYNGRTVYTTNGDYIIIGMVFDKNRQNITPAPQLSQREEDKVDLSWLDLSSALKIGDGEHIVIEFTDVDCPYCRRAEPFFYEADATRYIFFMALDMHPEAKKKSVHILCSEDPETEYQKVLTDQLSEYKSCEKGLETFDIHEGYAKRLKITGTPMFYIDNILVEGANPVIKDMVKK